VRARVAKCELGVIRIETDDLCADVRDVRTVVAVATETWGEENEQTASTCIGVLDLIDYKLKLIECAAQKIVNFAKGEKS
jgi:hypothetical protein